MRKLKGVVIASVTAGIVLLATILGAAQAPAYRAPRTAEGVEVWCCDVRKVGRLAFERGTLGGT